MSELWTEQPEVEPIEGWTIGEVDTESQVIARRVLIGTILTVGAALVVASSWFITGRADGSVEATLAEVERSTSDLAVSIGELTPVMFDMADGTLDDRELAVTSASQVDASARALFSTAASLPTSPEFADQRSATVAASDDAIGLAREVSKSTAYVSSVQVMLNRPDFPYVVSGQDLVEVGEMTATWVTRFISMSTSLPEVEAFADHRSEMLHWPTHFPLGNRPISTRSA